MLSSLYAGRSIMLARFDAMVDIMVLYPMFDNYIDGYRHRRDRCIEVPFQEYLNFILYVLDQKRWLTASTQDLKSYALSYTTDHSPMAFQFLYRNYVTDVLSAAAKELHLAEERGREATLIRFGIVNNPVSVPLGTRVTAYSLDKYHDFYRRLDLLGYRLPSQFKFESNKQIAEFIDLAIKCVLGSRFQEVLIA